MRTCTLCGGLAALDWLRAAGPYEGALRDILHAFKYQGRRSLADRLAPLVIERCAHALAGADAVVPVPLHVGRRWSRGFNQADLLARGLRLPVWRTLRRRRRTVPQSALSDAARWSNLDDAFGLSRPASYTRSRLAGVRVVLVDDVSTTGATLEACARVLKRAGVAEVGAVVVARTVRLTHPHVPPAPSIDGCQSIP
jgi:ComF family protein